MSTSPGTIRPAAASDCSSLAALSIEVWLGTYLREGVSGHFADYVLDHYTPAHFAAALQDPLDRVLVAEHQMGITGYIRLTHNRPSPAKTASQTEISTLYVQPRHHGGGTGQRLLTAGLTLCQQNAWDAPWLTTNSENAPAIRFYLRNGFERVGVTHFTIYGETYPNDIFQFCDHLPANATTTNALQNYRS